MDSAFVFKNKHNCLFGHFLHFCDQSDRIGLF